MNFKKRVNGSWTDTPHYIHKTDTNTLTTPAVIYPNDTTATVSLKGNMSQSGTPTPNNPIQPQECGERTGNLFDKNNYNIVYGYFIAEGTTTITAEYSNNIVYIPCKPNTTYTVSKILSKRFGIGYTIDKPAAGVTVYGAVINYTATSLTVTTDSSAKYLVGYIRNGNIAGESSLSNIVNSLQITESSTAIPYEPYGVKIPILNNSQTTNVYLGEVETTRKIKKLVLTGEETILRDREREGSWRFFTDRLIFAKGSTAICSHFENIGTDGVKNSDNIGFSIFNEAQFGCRFPKSIAGTAADFKAYLAAQYAAGTPVTVWYVLATEETGIVNEPLMKIGDYADEVSGITISVTAGANTLSVDTTLQPSEVTAMYKGWHPVADVHEYASNYTIATLQALTIAQLQTHTISDLQGGEWS